MASPARAGGPPRAVPTYLTLIFVATEALLVLTAAAHWWSTREISRGSAAVLREVEAIRRLDGVGSLVARAESLLRGYALTGEESFRAPYATARDALAPALADLRAALPPGSPAEAEEFGRLGSLVERKVLHMERVAAATAAGAAAAAADAIRDGAGQALMTEIRATLGALAQRRVQALSERRERAERLQAQSRLASLGITALAMLVIAAFYRRMRRYLEARGRAEAELGRTNESLNVLVAERTAELTHLSQHLISQHEIEKAAVARELHDALGSNLTAVDIDLKWVEKRLRDREPELADRLRRALDVLEQSVDVKRGVIEALRPSLLDMLGLATALEALCEDFTRRTGIDCIPDLDQDLPELPPDVSIALYRIVQEALSNVGRHAPEAKVVRVRLQREDELLHLTVTDDGGGIAPDAVTRPDSHGLFGMRERLRVLGGTLSIRRGPGGRGTVIDAVAPRPV